MRAGAEWMERHQVALYLAALALGAAVGVLAPGASAPLETAITPTLGLLLYATFLGVPFSAIGRAFRDGRFLAAIGVVNFVLAPAVAYGLSRFVAGDPAVVAGVLLVLLTPCIDYVIVFTGLAGGSRARLLAATPLLMLAQMALLPVYLWLMAGPALVAAVDLEPFVEAFALLILLPLALATVTQFLAARARWARRVEASMGAAMVPLMMLTLAVVVGSQSHAISGQALTLLALLPLYTAFAVVLFGIGAVAGRAAGLDAAGRRALVFAAVTRNSLVVLPLALALPPGFSLTPLVIVTQTLVELIVMVGMVWLVPRVIRGAALHRSGPGGRLPGARGL